MTTAPIELVVAEDGSIPAARLAALGVHPGSHLRVIAYDRAQQASISGALTDWPDVAWEDFTRGSVAATSDAAIADSATPCAS